MAITKQQNPKRIKIPSVKLADDVKLGKPSLGDHTYTNDELEEIIDAAVNLMEFALQRKSFPILDHPEPKKRLPADKLLYIYHDMQAHQDADSDTDCDEEEEITEAEAIVCSYSSKEEAPEDDKDESQQPLI